LSESGASRGSLGVSTSMASADADTAAGGCGCALLLGSDGLVVTGSADACA
jgi:hypothetical protein